MKHLHRFSLFTSLAAAWCHQLVRAEGMSAGPVEEIRQIRALSGVTFWSQSPRPLDRQIYVEAGKLCWRQWLVVSRLILPHTRTAERTGRTGPSHSATGDAQRKMVGLERGNRDTKQRRALHRAQALVETIAGNETGLPPPSVPVELLTAMPLSPASFHPRTEDLREARRRYAERPSRLVSLACLELALLHRELGDLGAYRTGLTKALAAVAEGAWDFRTDIEMRRLLVGYYNFARPETCILFLVAEEARRRQDAATAVKYYTMLIDKAPASPYASEALVRLTMMRGVAASDIESAKQRVLETFPCVWGCSRVMLMANGTTREQFAKQMPRLIEEVAEEAREREKAASTTPHQNPKGG